MGYNLDTLRWIPCSHLCGWRRYYNDHPDWLKEKIMHPVWGYVTQEQIVRNELRTHDCVAHEKALSKFRRVLGGPTRITPYKAA